jgi:hypothetical protein
MKHVFTFLLLWCIIGLDAKSQAVENDSHGVEFKAGFTSNYLVHLFAVADIAFHSDYDSLYAHTVSYEDVRLLKENETMLAFANGKSGGLTFPFFFLPAWLELEDEAEFREYFNLLIRGLETNNYDALFHRFPVDTTDPILAPSLQLFNISDSIWRIHVEPEVSGIRPLASVFIRNAATYRKEVWVDVQPILHERAEHLNQLFNDLQIASKWFDITGLEFDETYQIFLTYASENGPDANSLSFDKNMFHYNSSDDFFLDFISHETGTHLLFPVSDSLQKSYNKLAGNGRWYAATECLSMYYNSIIREGKELSYRLPQFRDGFYLPFFDSLYTTGIKTPEKLLRLGAEADLP